MKILLLDCILIGWLAELMDIEIVFCDALVVALCDGMTNYALDDLLREGPIDITGAILVIPLLAELIDAIGLADIPILILTGSVKRHCCIWCCMVGRYYLF